MGIESRRESFYLTLDNDTKTEELSCDQIEISYWEFANFEAVIADLKKNDKRFREWLDEGHQCPACKTGLTKTANDPCSKCEQEVEKQEQAFDKQAHEIYTKLGI
ncbi:MAG: hypothetical protein UT24_C0003G0050 [Candidatus Woesebacteria bacterium GW2011_GWB1_39_12]|uniref:Uncharacterized protein n=1 Tax=Candidatus Woesebacteria bacterium GW2011_GWB1_39_12 TaxID=1618574 RepID=A0A0G0MEN8_9BACT|nr:MAG: hypothetical protein UT24_C0003G0050 [Candidatus Woesebacteria bacterium GW2011_GWB1_39_12]